MANWFGSSTSVFKGRAPEAPQPFEIDCECGQRHTGLRRQQHQRIICRSCGTALFILPKDVYPASSESTPASSAKSLSVVIEEESQVIVLEEDDVPVEAAPAKHKSSSKAASQASKTAAAAPKQQQPASTPQPLPPKVEREKKPKPQGPLLTPLRMVSIAMIGIVGLTLLHMIRAQRLEDARRTLTTAVEHFNTALQEHNWTQARSQINQVVESLDILGREDYSALRHRQFQREIDAMGNLARSSLFEILEESDANQARNASGWQETFESQHAGQWLVMELPARRGAQIVPPASEKRHNSSDAEPLIPRYEYDFDFPISVGGAGRSVDIELQIEAFNLLAWDEQGRSVVVGAQLTDLKLSEDRTRWIITFDPETAYLWANIETYEGLGFTFAEWNPREQMQALLNEQAVALGIQQPDASTAPAPSELALREGGNE